MKYYMLEINGNLVRSSKITQYTAWKADLFCNYTEDLILTEKFTSEEVERTKGKVKALTEYFEEFKYVGGSTPIVSWSFVEIKL